MYYELRTYTLDPLKMADWLALYQSHALDVQSEHLGNLVGFFTSEFGDVNQVVHIWGYASLDDRIARRTAMAADPRWAAFRGLTASSGPLCACNRGCCGPPVFRRCSKTRHPLPTPERTPSCNPSNVTYSSLAPALRAWLPP